MLSYDKLSSLYFGLDVPEVIQRQIMKKKTELKKSKDGTTKIGKINLKIPKLGTYCNKYTGSYRKHSSVHNRYCYLGAFA